MEKSLTILLPINAFKMFSHLTKSWITNINVSFHDVNSTNFKKKLKKILVKNFFSKSLFLAVFWPKNTEKCSKYPIRDIRFFGSGYHIRKWHGYIRIFGYPDFITSRHCKYLVINLRWLVAFCPGWVPGQVSVGTSLTRKPVMVARPTHPKIYGIFDDHNATWTEYKREAFKIHRRPT